VATPSSFTLKPQQSETAAFFLVGPGGWVIQAKAGVIAVGGVPVTPTDTNFLVSVTMTLIANTPDEVVIDETTIVTDNHAAILSSVGFSSSASTTVELKVRNDGGGPENTNAEVRNIVMSAIKQDDLIRL
jgi:hypothetical protein